MTDKEKIREEVERLKSQLLRGACSSQIAMETRCKEKAYNEVLAILDTMQEEPVSRTPADIESAMQEVEEKSRAFTEAHHGEDADTILAQMRGEEPVSEGLEEASKEWLRPQLDKSYANYGEGKMMELTHFDGYAMLDAIEFGAEWQKNHLWKPADGDDLPIIDREVIALLDNGKVVFVHRPPEYWDGKNIDTGKVTRYYPKTYDKGGWNIPDIKWWLDCSTPKEIEL